LVESDATHSANVAPATLTTGSVTADARIVVPITRKFKPMTSARGIPTFFRHVVRAVRIAAGDPRIPRPLRWLAALGLMPSPGPFDELLLLLVAIPLALFYRRELGEAWRQARD
jgi:hypothetical protein